jgi:hypothetical protein
VENAFLIYGDVVGTSVTVPITIRTSLFYIDKPDVVHFHFISTCKPGTAASHTRQNGLYKMDMINQLTLVAFQSIKFNRLARQCKQNKALSPKMKLYHSIIIIFLENESESLLPNLMDKENIPVTYLLGTYCYCT